jgi:uncharacterized protein
MRMKRLVGTAGVVFAVLLTPGTAHAQESTPPCEAMVVDTSGRVADVARVTAAAEKLAASANAYVRVRVESGVGNDAEARLRQLQAFCPDWMSGGLRRPDLIVVVVLPDTRQTGIFYGSKFDGTLAGRTTPIQTETMNPRFKEGFFDVGIADGLDALDETVDGKLLVGTPSGTLAPQYPSSPSATFPSFDPAPSSNGSSGGGGFVAILVLVLIAAAVIAISKAVTSETASWSSGPSSGQSTPSRQRRASGWFGGSTNSGSSHSSWDSSSSSGSSWSSSSDSSSSSSSSSDSGGGGSSTSW